MKQSEIISQFLDLMRSAENECACAKECLTKHENATQDILHDLELNEHNMPEEFAALALKLADIRKERRIDKGRWEFANVISQTISAEHLTVPLKAVERMLGNVRKIEKYHENRVYRSKTEESEK